MKKLTYFILIKSFLFSISLFLVGCVSNPKSLISDAIAEKTIIKPTEKSVYIDQNLVFDVSLLMVDQDTYNTFIKNGWNVVSYREDLEEIESENQKVKNTEKTVSIIQKNYKRARFWINSKLYAYWNFTGGKKIIHLSGYTRMIDLQTGKVCAGIVCENILLEEYLQALMAEVNKNIIVK